jgi:hypothetical protein
MNRFQGLSQGSLEEHQVDAIFERGLPLFAVATWVFLLSVSIALSQLSGN